jgi:transposase-like protein
MGSNAPSYHEYRFPSDTISQAVWLCHRCFLGFRDFEDDLAQHIERSSARVTVFTNSSRCGLYAPDNIQRWRLSEKIEGSARAFRSGPPRGKS